MATYSDLQTDQYYLIQQPGGSDVRLVYVLMETNKAVFLEIEDGNETLVWKLKSAAIEIVEELTEGQADLYESITFEDEDEEDFEWDGDDEGVIPIHN